MNVDFWLNEDSEVVGYEAGFIVLDGDGEHGGAEQITLYFYDSRPEWRKQSVRKLGELRDAINQQIARLVVLDETEPRRGRHEHH